MRQYAIASNVQKPVSGRNYKINILKSSAYDLTSNL